MFISAVKVSHALYDIFIKKLIHINFSVISIMKLNILTQKET
jgi:hypothetical protein